MNAVKNWNYLVGKVCWLMGLALLWATTGANAALEEHFDVLQIGAHTYKNVTVTTKAKDYVFLMHSAGLTNIKVKDLPPELAEQLGYVQKPVAQAKPALSWLKNTAGALGKQPLPQLEERLRSLGAEPAALKAWVTPQRLGLLLGVIGVAYLGFCACGAAICQKAGHPAGGLVWLPVLQLVPLLRAAGMSQWWLLAFLLPVLNLVAQVVWSIKIVQARAKSPWVALFLLLPVLNLLAFAYLAFSSAAPAKAAPVVEVMTLDAA
jgi:hypothetical protein